MTRTLLDFIRIFILLVALLGVKAGQVYDVAAEAQSPRPGVSLGLAPPRVAQLTAERTTPGCATGQCIIGRTNTVPPSLLCGACPPETGRRVTFCPKLLAPGAVVYLNNKPYGHGFDSTPRVKGDPEFCYRIHGVWVNDCHLESWPKRVECEMELMHGCPVWQYTVDDKSIIHGCFDDRTAAASCDHFGSVGHQDDPQTPTTGDTIWNLKGFEGLPLACGLQRNSYGPMAGFFTVAHGIGYVRACKPDGAGCGSWQSFEH